MNSSSRVPLVIQACVPGVTAALHDNGTVLLVIIGAHVDRATVLAAARTTGSQAIQIFLAAPHTWAAPKPRSDEESIHTSGLLVYAHAPYLVNPASLNPDVRSKSRRAILEHSYAVQAVGARGLVGHRGHPTGTGTVEDELTGWLEVLEGAELPVPILLENPAGGNAAVARRFDALSSAGHQIGVCLDTCHAHAGGEELATACELEGSGYDSFRGEPQ